MVRRYSSDAYRRLFSPGVRGQEVPPGADEGHYFPDRHFFEWWYFDVALSDGGWLVAVLHSALFNVGDHRPTVDVRYYPPGALPIIAIGRFTRREYQAERGRFRVGTSWAAEEGGVYRLHLRQGPLMADLTFCPELPGWKVGTGHLFADIPGGRYFDWVVPIPRARVEGWLELEGASHPVMGVGYHDHNWGNVYLPAVFQGWRWGRVWGGRWTLVFGDLSAPGGALHVTPLLIGYDGQVGEMPQGFHLRDAEPESRRLTLEAAGEQGIFLSLFLQEPMDSVVFPIVRPPLVPWRRPVEAFFFLSQPVPLLGRLARALVGRGRYHRQPVQGTLNVRGERVEVQGVMEEMAFCSQGGRC